MKYEMPGASCQDEDFEKNIRNWTLSFQWPSRSVTRLSQFAQDFPSFKTRRPASGNLLSPRECGQLVAQPAEAVQEALEVQLERKS